MQHGYLKCAGSHRRELELYSRISRDLLPSQSGVAFVSTKKRCTDVTTELKVNEFLEKVKP